MLPGVRCFALQSSSAATIPSPRAGLGLGGLCGTRTAGALGVPVRSGRDAREIAWAVERSHRAGGRGMARRVGLGPVFAFEWRLASRRWPAYALRALTGVLLLGATPLVWAGAPGGRSAAGTVVQPGAGGEAVHENTAILPPGL